MKLFVGSTNPVKINAVKHVFSSVFPNEKIFVKGLEVPSQVSNQPIGLTNVVNGAVNRAENTMKKAKEIYSSHFKDGDERIFSIGIEAGLVSVPFTISGYLDYQFCAILDRSGKLSIGSNSGWEYPSSVINSIIENRELEIADIMGEISGNKEIKHQGGAIGYFSKGKLKREELTRQGIFMALIPWLNKKRYF
ncbi:MAG: inosine/xanthosine triphosphatase [Promethearchaeota archaeon]